MLARTFGRVAVLLFLATVPGAADAQSEVALNKIPFSSWVLGWRISTFVRRGIARSGRQLQIKAMPRIIRRLTFAHGGEEAQFPRLRRRTARWRVR